MTLAGQGGAGARGASGVQVINVLSESRAATQCQACGCPDAWPGCSTYNSERFRTSLNRHNFQKMDEKLIKQAFDARMKGRRIELEAKCGLEFSTAGGGACHPSGLKWGTAGGPFRFSFWSLCAEAAGAGTGRGPRVWRDRLSQGAIDPWRSSILPSLEESSES